MYNPVSLIIVGLGAFGLIWSISKVNAKITGSTDSTGSSGTGPTKADRLANLRSQLATAQANGDNQNIIDIQYQIDLVNLELD